MFGTISAFPQQSEGILRSESANTFAFELSKLTTSESSNPVTKTFLSKWYLKGPFMKPTRPHFQKTHWQHAARCDEFVSRHVIPTQVFANRLFTTPFMNILLKLWCIIPFNFYGKKMSLTSWHPPNLKWRFTSGEYRRSSGLVDGCALHMW